MAKGQGYKTVKTANKEFHGRKDNAGMGKADHAPATSGKKGDSRSKSMMAPIKPQKGC